MLVYINHTNIFCISDAEILSTYCDIFKNSELAIYIYISVVDESSY